jgi:TPR repeat protein
LARKSHQICGRWRQWGRKVDSGRPCYDDSSGASGGNNGENGKTDDPEFKWKQRMRSFRHDIWSWQNPCHFLEAVGWGTAIITGFQISELHHRGSRRASIEASDGHYSGGCWVRCVVGPTVKPSECFHMDKWFLSYMQHAALFVASAFGQNFVQLARFILPPASPDTDGGCQVATSVDARDVSVHSNVGDQSTAEGRQREINKQEIESELAYYAWPTFTRSTTSAKDDDDQKSSNSALHQTLESCTGASAISAWQQMVLNYVASAQLNSKALKHARRGEYGAAVHLWLKVNDVGAKGYVNEKALFNLAICYENGLGVEKDVKKAIELYMKAADLGHARSAYNAAILLMASSSSVVDSQTALKMMEKAAEMGLKEGQRELGVLYTEEPRRDMAKAAQLFEKAALQKDTAATYYLGICFEHGWGVELSETEAARLYEAAATAGHMDALYNLAVFYEKGLGGLPVDVEHAQGLYRAAAKAGNVLAAEHVQASSAKSDRASDRMDSVDEKTLLVRSSSRPIVDKIKTDTGRRQIPVSRFYHSTSSDSESDDDCAASSLGDWSSQSRGCCDEWGDGSFSMSPRADGTKACATVGDGLPRSYSDDDVVIVASSRHDVVPRKTVRTVMTAKAVGFGSDLSEYCGKQFATSDDPQNSEEELYRGVFGNVILPHVSSFG